MLGFLDLVPSQKILHLNDADPIMCVEGREVERSLVAVEEHEGTLTRYRLLEMLRQYGRERLLAGGEAEELYLRNAGYYRAMAEEAEPALLGPQQAAWLDRLDAESTNIRQGLRWALDVGDAQEGLRLAGALMWYWHQRAYLGEGRQWLADLLAQPAAAARTTVRARALVCLAFALTRSHLATDGNVGHAPLVTLVQRLEQSGRQFLSLSGAQ